MMTEIVGRDERPNRLVMLGSDSTDSTEAAVHVVLRPPCSTLSGEQVIARSFVGGVPNNCSQGFVAQLDVTDRGIGLSARPLVLTEAQLLRRRHEVANPGVAQFASAGAGGMVDEDHVGERPAFGRAEELVGKPHSKTPAPCDHLL